MATLGRPGVYISETLTPLTATATSSSTAVAAFVGTATYGPAGPNWVTSWSQYASTYNGFGNGIDLLPYAVYSYFANGGTGCYVVRAVPSDATGASLTINDTEVTPAPLLTLTSKAVGTYANEIYVTVTATSAGRFNLSIAVGTATNTVDQYLDVTLNPTDPRYLIPMINSPISGSSTVSAAYVSAVSPWTTLQTPATLAATPLTGGTDGTSANVNYVTSAEMLSTISSPLLVNVPGVSAATTVNPLLAWAAAQGDVMVIVDAPQASSTYSATLAAYLALAPSATSGTPYTNSSYGAMYGPWLVCSDPSSLASGAVRTLPPGGAVLGQYCVNDQAAGTYQTPAGTQTTLANVVGVDTVFQNSDLDTLNEAGINVIRAIPGYGYCIVGARTLNYNMPSRYISIRRNLIYIETLLSQSVQWALFQPNTPVLWAKISSSISQILQGLMQAGYLASTSAASAFYVTCDASNNTPAAVAAGQVNIQVGVALSAPAEYIVINIGLFDTTTSTSSSLA